MTSAPDIRLPHRNPVTTLEDLAKLDHDEVVEGYSDGTENFPCGPNRSRSYWHGWRNGMVDCGHAEKDDAQADLARAWVEAMGPHRGTVH